MSYNQHNKILKDITTLHVCDILFSARLKHLQGFNSTKGYFRNKCMVGPYFHMIMSHTFACRKKNTAIYRTD